MPRSWISRHPPVPEDYEADAEDRAQSGRPGVRSTSVTQPIEELRTHNPNFDRLDCQNGIVKGKNVPIMSSCDQFRITITLPTVAVLEAQLAQLTDSIQVAQRCQGEMEGNPPAGGGQLTRHGVDMSSPPSTLLEDLPSQEQPQSELCMICMSQPREIRLCCGHLFACAECLSKLTLCALCREPITTGYYVKPPLVDDENSLMAAGYISSGSETYASMDDGNCCMPGCGPEATHCFHCSRCSTTDDSVSRYLCSLCLVEWTCPMCQQPADQKDVVTIRSGLTMTSDSEEDPEAGPFY